MSKSNPFDLPPPWNAGYALPQNVDDEGLERHAYTTAWAPRGSYDDPKVGYAGYAVPGYVKDEGYGRGAMVTRWAQRGTYYGPKVKHWLDKPTARVVGAKPMPGGATQLKIQTMAGVDLPAPFTQFGKRAAAAIMGRVDMLPQAQRKTALKQMMDAIDPTLWSRVADLTRGNVAKGMSAKQGLRLALESALSSGIVAEMIQAGKRRSAPQARTLLGLGCYGPRQALGATMSQMLLQPQLMPVASEPMPAMQAISGGTLQTLAVGPWVLPDVENRAESFVAAGLSSEQKSSLATMIAKASVGYAMTQSQAWLATPTNWIDLASIGIGTGKVPVNVTDGRVPIAKFTHPTSGAREGLFFRFTGTKANPTFTLTWRRDLTLGEAVWNAIVTLHAAPIRLIAETVKEVVGVVSGLACDLVNNPLIKPAAAAAGAVYGGPTGASAGAVGADIAKNACGQPMAPPPLPPPTEPMNLTPILLIGGVGIAALVLLRGKKT